MAQRIAAAALMMMVLAAGRMDACSLSQVDPNDMLENEPVYSANGLFCVIPRYYEGIPDFTSERAGKVLHLDDPPSDEERVASKPRKNVTVALYEVGGSRRRLISEFPIEEGSFRDLLVADSGQSVIAVQGLSSGACWSNASTPQDPMVTIFRADGRRAGTLTAGDIFTPSDVWEITNDFFAGIDFKLRHESEERELVVLNIPVRSGHEEPRYETRRIDIATATLLDEKREIFPSPHVYATPGQGSEELFGRAVLGPLPAFPEIMIKARIRGIVGIHVVVSESGDVVSVSLFKSLPFGADVAAVEAVKQWKFKPRHGVKMAGDIVVHFMDIDAATLREVTRNAPPRE